MNLTNQYQPSKVRVELLPLIDVVFLLLVFFLFLMLNMSLQHSIAVHLPSVSTTATVQQESMQISIDKHGQLYLDHEAMPLAKLMTEVQRLQAKTSRPILIHGDTQTDLGIAITLLDQLKTAGFQQVSFATDVFASTTTN